MLEEPRTFYLHGSLAQTSITPTVEQLSSMVNVTKALLPQTVSATPQWVDLATVTVED